MRRLLFSLSICFIAIGPLDRANGDLVLDPMPPYFAFAIEVGAKLFQRYPPNRFYILNYGPTTAVTSAYFRSRLVGRIEPQQYYAELMMTKLKDLDLPHDAKEWERIFAAILPSDEVLAGRPLIVHRYLWTGRTFISFMQALRNYRDQYRSEMKVGLFVVDGNSAAQFPEALREWADGPELFYAHRSDMADVWSNIFYTDRHLDIQSQLRRFSDRREVDLATVLAMGERGKAFLNRSREDRLDLVFQDDCWTLLNDARLKQSNSRP